MKKEALFETLGDINNQYIKDAHMEKNRKINFVWTKWAAAAAGLMLAVVIGIPALGFYLSTIDYNVPAAEDIQGTVVNNPIQELLAEKVENDAEKEASAGEQDNYLFVVNEVDSIVSADMDVEYTFYNKLPEYIWQQILEEFQVFTGIGYEDFMAKIPSVWEYVNFYSLSTRGYKDANLKEEYRLHDYVFEYRTVDGGEAIIALCTLEAPLRDYFIKSDNPKQSKINDVPVTIYEYESMYIVQFAYENVNYDIETINVTLDELKNLLTSILTASESAPNNIESAANSDMEDAPADEHGIYMEAVNSDDLRKDASEIFGGSYIDENGKFVVVLTEDTSESRTLICEELGISESSATFKTGKYTLSYLTELQAKISNAMVNKEVPFVVTSGVYETINRIKVSVTTDDEAELEKLYVLDTIGGAIEVEYIGSGATYDLLAPKVEIAD